MKWKQVLVAGVAAAALFGSSTSAVAAETTTERLGGKDRYHTSVEISKKTFPSTSSTVFLASGEDFADALVAGAAGGSKNAAVLLTRKNEIPEVVQKELERLQPQLIVIVGGRGAISPAVAEDAKQWASQTVERWAGENRYGTAKRVAQEVYSDTATTAFIASGEDFPDALGGGLAAARLGGPLLLTNSNKLTAQTIDYLKELENLKEIVVLGGVGAVSDTAAATAASYAKVKRVAGKNRFETSVATSQLVFPGTTPVEAVVLANGVDFPDALSGTPLAAVWPGPVLLVGPNTLPPNVCTEIRRLQPKQTIFALGGAGALSDAVLTQAKKCTEPLPVEPDTDGDPTPST